MKLYIKTLGGFDVKLNDESIFKDTNRSYKLYRLFQYFITFKNKKLLPESIIDNLWPDNESYDPKNMLRVQIYRLRQNIYSIVPEDIDISDYLEISFNNGYYSLSVRENTIIDIDVFEQLILNGDNIKSVDINGAINLYRSALEIYNGSYLEESPYELWLVPIRNYYRRLYLKTLFKLIEILEEKERYEDIIVLCEDALAIEPYEEAIHIYLMECLLKQGQIKSALSHYEYVTSIQSFEQVSVSSIAMKDIYNKIQNQYSVKGEIQISNMNNCLEDEDLTGPLFCDSTYFKFSYNLRKKKRKKISSDEDDYICLITLNKDCGKEELNKWTKQMKMTLEKSLRKGDIFTFWNDTQIIILLLDSNEYGPKRIKERIFANLASYMNEIQISFTKLSNEDHYLIDSII